MIIYRLQRRLMTFIEMMVVLAIISLLGGLVAINVNKAVVDQRFRTEVAAIVNQLRLAQNLMLVLDQDVTVKFKDRGDQKTIDYWLEMQCPALKGWDKELARRPPPLKTIRALEFDAELQEAGEGLLELKFMSGGTVMSRGVLLLSTSDSFNKKGALERYICLPGFPAAISASMGEIPKAACLEEISGDFKMQITQATVQEIASKMAAVNSSVEAVGDNAVQNPENPAVPTPPAP